MPTNAHHYHLSSTIVNVAPFNKGDITTLFGSQAAHALPASWRGMGVSTDTRTMQQGNIFVALKGSTFDAHTLLAQAAESGAAAVVVNAHAEIPSEVLSALHQHRIPLVHVPNTLHALGSLANAHRRRFSVPIVAVAGSAGKTTTKDLTAHVLEREFGAGKVLKTEANLNNQIGVPQTLLQLRAEHRAAVIELGTNEPGEIAVLSAMVQPTHGVITNIGKEHLEKLGDLNGVEREETALFDYLERTGGTALVNMDDERLRKHAAYLQSLFTYGIAHKADFMADVTMAETGEPIMNFTYKRGTQRFKATVQLRVVGMTMARNALAAAAVGCSLGISLAAIMSALVKFTPTASAQGYGRMVVETLPLERGGTVRVLNDCYNANPISMDAGLETLRTLPTAGKKIAVLGDMRELGAVSFAEHCMLLERLSADAAFDHVIVLGAEMHRAFAAKAHQLPRSIVALEREEALERLVALLESGDALLIKGSRGMKLEEVLQALRAKIAPQYASSQAMSA